MLTIAESKRLARGKPLPVRIELWCAVNEPRDRADEIAGRLCLSFGAYALDELTPYELNVWRAVTEGGWKK